MWDLGVLGCPESWDFLLKVLLRRGAPASSVDERSQAFGGSRAFGYGDLGPAGVPVVLKP